MDVRSVGVAYYLAIAWSAWDHSVWAWPVIISVAVTVTVVVATVKAGKHPKTTLGRAISSIWIALGISMFLLLSSSRPEWKIDRSAYLCGRDIGHTGGLPYAVASAQLRRCCEPDCEHPVNAGEPAMISWLLIRGVKDQPSEAAA